MSAIVIESEESDQIFDLKINKSLAFFTFETANTRNILTTSANKLYLFDIENNVIMNIREVEVQRRLDIKSRC